MDIFWNNTVKMCYFIDFSDVELGKWAASVDPSLSH